MPFPKQVSPFALQAENHTHQWVDSFSFFQNDFERDAFLASKFSWLSAYTYPFADYNEQLIVSDWNTWLFLLDDINDQADLGKDHQKLQKRLYDLIELLNHNHVPKHKGVDPIAESLCDLWTRIRKQHPNSKFQQRFIQSVKEYFDGCIWEARNRYLSIAPKTDDYIQNRYFSGAMYTSLNLGDLTEKIDIPSEVINHPTLINMTKLCISTVSWANDLFSFAREHNLQDVHNLVLTIKKQKQLSIEVAVDEVIRIHNEEIAHFCELEQSVPSFGEDYDKQIYRYIRLLKTWMRGHIDWVQCKTLRYE
ncbi:terpene synthase family protein [Risungbinella massiliensis]|uniref:terpene synthase family protein n=1 Tax=Risungbinella massiliensis TaxID=1329796 RepID=UPI0005CC5934|nr:hypothetical protein [Risungbinella massiliensis]